VVTKRGKGAGKMGRKGRRAGDGKGIWSDLLCAMPCAVLGLSAVSGEVFSLRPSHHGHGQ